MAKDPIFKETDFEDSGGFGPTYAPGVYAVCVMENDPGLRPEERTCRVIYIGSSQCIHKRVMSMAHVYRRVFSLVRKYWVYVMDMECDDYREKERLLIRKYKPRFNKTHAR